MSDGDLYSRLLLTKRHGYPLSHPQPCDNLPEESRMKGIEIGDVGVLTPDGSFDVFFNICRESDDPVNRFGVPFGFVPVPLGPNDFTSWETYHPPGSHVSNTTISKRRLDVNAGVENNVFLPVGAGAEVEISTSSKQTAVLLLPDGASRTDLRFPDRFRDHALKHAKSWYNFLSGLGRTLENGELYLITGVDKSASWSVAAVENYTEDCTISLKLKAAQIGSAGTSYAWEWETVARFADSGPRRPPGEDSGAKNQTVFLRGFRIAIPSLPWSKKTIALPIVEPQSSANLTWFRTLFFRSPSRRTHTISHGRSTGHDVLRDGEFEPIIYSPATHKPYHPADAINKYLVTASSSEVLAVVTHDSEWAFVLREDEDVPTESELIRRICEKYTFAGGYLQRRGTGSTTPHVSSPLPGHVAGSASLSSYTVTPPVHTVAVRESGHRLPLRIASLQEFGHRNLYRCLVVLALLWLFPYRSNIYAYVTVAMSVLFWVYAEYYRLDGRMKRLRGSINYVEEGLYHVEGRLVFTGAMKNSDVQKSASHIRESLLHLKLSMSHIQERLPWISSTWAPQFRARVQISMDIGTCEHGLRRIQQHLHLLGLLQQKLKREREPQNGVVSLGAQAAKMEEVLVAREEMFRRAVERRGDDGA